MSTAPRRLADVLVRPKKIKLRMTYDPETENKGARLLKLRQMTTALFRYERIEATFMAASELRPYPELILQEALKYGPRHKPTMELLDFWCLEKDLIHKVFKIFVPRYEKFGPPFTKLHMIPSPYPSHGFHKHALVEMKGNPYPPVEQRTLDKKLSLANVLLSEAKREYARQQQRIQDDLAAQKESSTSPSSSES